MSARVYPLVAKVGKGIVLLARILHPADATPVLQAELTAINAMISVNGAAASQVTLTIASVIFDTLQTDARWTEDSTGYNFAYEVPGAKFSAVGNAHIEIVFDPVTGEDFSATWEGPIRSSKTPA